MTLKIVFAIYWQALRLLHLVAGVSYYKAAVPEEIRIEGYAIDGATAALLTEVYENGLGEFAYRNGLTLRGLPCCRPRRSRPWGRKTVGRSWRE